MSNSKFLPCGAFRHSLKPNSQLVLSGNTSTETPKPNNKLKRVFSYMFLYFSHVLKSVNLLCKVVAKSCLNKELEALNIANE